MTEVIELPVVTAENMPAIATEEGLKPFLDHAKSFAEEAGKEVNDAATAKGRAAIGSLAAKVSSSKTAITNPGADYVKALKQRGVDAQKLLAQFASDMDAVRDEIKNPADEWKAKEKARIDGLHKEISFIGNYAMRSEPVTGEVFTAEFLTNQRKELAAMTFDAEKFGDLHQQAMETWSQSLEFLDTAIKERTEYEEALAESERLKAEMAEVKRKKDIEDAAARAKSDAEAAAAAKVADAEAQAKLAKDNAEREKQEAVEAERKRAADEQAEKDEQYKEAQRLEAEKAANVENQRAVNNKTMNELMQCAEGLTDTQAKKIISNLASGKFSHITINY